MDPRDTHMVNSHWWFRYVNFTSPCYVLIISAEESFVSNEVKGCSIRIPFKSHSTQYESYRNLLNMYSSNADATPKIFDTRNLSTMFAMPTQEVMNREVVARPVAFPPGLSAPNIGRVVFGIERCLVVQRCGPQGIQILHRRGYGEFTHGVSWGAGVTKIAWMGELLRIFHGDAMLNKLLRIHESVGAWPFEIRR